MFAILMVTLLGVTVMSAVPVLPELASVAVALAGPPGLTPVARPLPTGVWLVALPTTVAICELSLTHVKLSAEESNILLNGSMAVATNVKG